MGLYDRALDIQMRAAHQFRSRSNVSSAVGGGYFTNVTHDKSDGSVLADTVTAGIQEIVTRGETFYCSPEIETMVMDVAQSMPTNWTLTPDALPTPMGFMSLHDSTVFSEWALGWLSVGDTAVIITTFAIEDVTVRIGRSIIWTYGTDIASVVAAFADHQEHIPSTGPFGASDVARAMKARMLFVAAIFEFMRDRILVSRVAQTRRHVARRVRDTIQHEPVVGIIELRKRQYESVEREGEPQHRDYSCQWIVRGHWRNQWYASLGRHQPKWITPYVKGPDDKPLKTPRANLFAVVR